ncbi:MAG: arsenate reductase ArsC [Chloroflexi bacterium]|nr:arsenate reductase ArsC [Chloroflexota bacterium]
MSEKLQVLILCTANSARSQMGEGLLRHIAGDKLDVFSAGRAPSGVNPLAIEAMRARGIDIASHHSHHIDQYLEREFDFVITLCDSAAESCPVFPGRAERIHWSLPDPAAVTGDEPAVLQSFIDVREGLEKKLSAWLRSHNLLERNEKASAKLEDKCPR